MSLCQTQGAAIRRIETFAVGAVRKSLTFFPDGRIDGAGFEAAVRSSRSRFADAAVGAYDAQGWPLAYGACGTVRALADEVGLAVNTVARVYRELESDGVVVTAGRRGTFVSPTAGTTRTDVQAAVAAYVDTVRRAGLGVTEAQHMVQDQWPR